MRDTADMQIITLGDDELITKPGFYHLPLERHHGQPCDGPSVTSSVLRRMEYGTPADVWAYSKLNPKRFEDKDTPAKSLGRVMALYIEKGEDGLSDELMILPATKPNRPTAAQLEKIKAGEGSEAGIKAATFWAKVDSDPREIVTKENWELISTTGQILAADPAASAALGGEPEVTMAWKDEATGIWCLARPDQTALTGMVTDYKRMSPMGYFNTRYVDRQITERGYDMQMAFAVEGFERLTGNKPEIVGLVCQSSAPPHSVILRDISKEDIEIGTFRNRDALDQFAFCLERGEWPGPGQHVGSYQRPKWQRDQILRRMGVEVEEAA